MRGCSAWQISRLQFLTLSEDYTSSTHMMFITNCEVGFVICLLCGLLQDAAADGSMMAGPADINIKSIEHCPEPDQYKYWMNVKRHKVNRTHEAFDGDADLGIPVDENMGIYINVARKAADGYKPNAYEFKGKEACPFLMKWVGKGFMELLEKIGQPSTCPLKAGSYSVKNFLIDYRQLPQTLPYGDFRADLYFIVGGENVMCIQVFLITKPKMIG